MDCAALRDDQWARLKGFVPGGAKGKRGPRTDNRKFLAEVSGGSFWMRFCGWRDRAVAIALRNAKRSLLARFAGATWRLSLGETALLSLDRDGRSGRDAVGAGARG